MAISARARREKLLESAEGYLLLNMADHALRELNAIADPEMCRFEWSRLRGEALREKKEYEEALDAYQLALDEQSGDLTVLMGMAWCYKRVNQLPRAIEAMEKAYHFNPKEPIVLFNLSCYYTLAGNKSEALAWLGRALRMDSDLCRLIADESDFDSLRDDPDFQMIVGTVDVSKTS